MTTDYANINKPGAEQLRLRQLPPVTNDKQQQTKTDNVVRLDSVKRQDFAKLTEEKAVESKQLPVRNQPDQEVSQSIKDLNIRAKYNVNVLSIRHETNQGTKINAFPTPDYIIKEGDRLIVAGEIKMINLVKGLS